MSSIGRPPVVAGVDGSPRDIAVVRRSVLMSRQHDVPLRVLHVVGPELAAGHEVLRAARRAVDEAGGVPEADYDLRAGSPAGGLRCPAPNATLVVVGAPARARPGREPSVAENLAASSPVPVLAVRGADPRPGPVVAALDGSAASSHVLAYAMEEADLTGRQILALHVADATAAAFPEGLEALTGLWGAKFPDVALDVRVVHGDPARALVAAGAGLLVLAARPPGRFAANMLGAVGRRVLYGSDCDVAVV